MSAGLQFVLLELWLIFKRIWHAMQRSEHTLPSTKTANTTGHLRLRPAIHLRSGDTVGAFTECPRGYDERPVFTSGLKPTKPALASEWVANQIAALGALCTLTDCMDRPLILPVPAAAITDPNMVDACVTAAAQTRLCNQELSFEFTDADLSRLGDGLPNFIRIFRQRGFRVSIDARKSWVLDLSAPGWLMIDTMRVRSTDIDDDCDLDEQIETARSAGVAIIAERALWRDGEYLASRGIDYALMPRADA